MLDQPAALRPREEAERARDCRQVAAGLQADELRDEPAIFGVLHAEYGDVRRFG